mmetsp:Transcript_42566/g.66683  ORF Transcript_42566/g.66683 Transcript_42566/m.66683 type:complete len:171 (+) Transcript_42566:217-729(+)
MMNTSIPQPDCSPNSLLPFLLVVSECSAPRMLTFLRSQQFHTFGPIQHLKSHRLDRCGPCKMIAPKYAELAAEFKHVAFCKVDVDANQETAAHCGIQAMPTFLFFKKSNKMHMVRGADVDALRKAVEDHSGDKWSSMEGQSLGGGSAPMSQDELRAKAAAAAAARFGGGK